MRRRVALSVRSEALASEEGTPVITWVSLCEGGL
jgi:hypothetical protein